MTQTLSFAILDDLNQKYYFSEDFTSYDELTQILTKIWDSFLSEEVEYGDRGYFFQKNTKSEDINDVLYKLKQNNYYVCNRINKYYVYAFAINYKRFWIWSKDCEAKIIEWPVKSYESVADNLDPEYDVNPVIKVMRMFNQ